MKPNPTKQDLFKEEVDDTLPFEMSVEEKKEVVRLFNMAVCTPDWVIKLKQQWMKDDYENFLKEINK